MKRFLAIPPLLWLMLFLGVSSLLLLPLSFATRGAYGEVVPVFTTENFSRLAGYSVLGWSGDYLRIAWRTVGLAGGTTAVTILVAYPMAFHIASMSRRWRGTWLVLVTIPFCTNLVVRVAGMEALCDPSLWLAKGLVALHLARAGDWLYPSLGAVYVGMVSSNLPFAIFPLYANVERLDGSLVEAARDLYAGRWRVFRHAVLPQTYAGLASAGLLTFIPALGTFLVSDLLGGAKTALLGNVIQAQFGSARDLPFGAALTLALVVLTLVGLWVLTPGKGNHR
jgi:spermidine/putrescine transport system permease protein